MPLEEQVALMPPLCGLRGWVVGCGFLGSALLRVCRAAGMQSLAIDREVAADVLGSAAAPAVLAAARARLEPELICCCAASHGGDEAAYRAVYLELPRALHAACPSARLLFCSSSSVYGGLGGAEVTEASPCVSPLPKARLLLEAEEAVLSMGGVVARLVPLYGASRCELLRRFVQREPELAGDEDRVLNYVHRADAARALLCLAQNPPPAGRVNVCGESFTRAEVYEALSRLTGLPRVATAAEGGRRGVSSQRVSAALLRSLGWEPQVQFAEWAARHWRDWN